MFATVMHQLTSPVNVGTIVRSHVAFGGEEIAFVGLDVPWRFRKNTQAFSRRLERVCRITYLRDDEEFFAWCEARAWSPIAIEISPLACPLAGFPFPKRPALVVGHEGRGLSEDFLARCAGIAVIPQFGDAPCLNAGVSAAIAMFELRRGATGVREIDRNKFSVPAARRVKGP